MSSHHIIRENQEPALVLVSPIRSEILNQLLEWSPKIFCNQAILDWVIDSGFKIDVIFGAADLREECLEKMEYQMPISFISFENDWENLFGIIQNQTVHIASNEEFNLNDFNANKEIVRYSDDFKEYRIKGEWKKWKNKGDKIQLDSKGILNIENLQMTDSSFEVLEDGMVKVSVKEGAVIREFFQL